MRFEGVPPLQVQVLACESLGVRAFAVRVETPAGILVVDPAVALAPRVQGYPPAPEELQAFHAAWGRIRQTLREARFVAITHYHHDHQLPYLPDAFPEPPPRVFLKSPEDTNRSQKARAALLLENLQARGISPDLPQRQWVDLGNRTRVWFSPSLFHGTTPRLGTVMMVGVEAEDHRILITSDIQGPAREDHLEAILHFAPHVLFLDPPMAPGGHMPEVFFSLMDRLFVELPHLKVVVVDHHPLRDLRMERWWHVLMDQASAYGVRVMMGAEWNGTRPMRLEARRTELWKTRMQEGERR